MYLFLCQILRAARFMRGPHNNTHRGGCTSFRPYELGGNMIGLLILLAIFVCAAWFAGRKYERKQFVKIGTPKSDLQKVLGVWKNEAR